MKTKTNSLKFLILFLISILFILSSCEKEDKVYTNLSGDWDLHYDFTTLNKKVDADMELTQNGTSLSGKIDDGTDEFKLLQSCCINGYDVTIKYYAAGVLLKQTGSVNSGFNEMSGSFTVRGIYAGTWEADRSRKQAALNSRERNTLNMIIDNFNK